MNAFILRESVLSEGAREYTSSQHYCKPQKGPVIENRKKATEKLDSEDVEGLRRGEAKMYLRRTYEKR